MFKFLIKAFNLLLIVSIWSYAYFLSINCILINFWNFSIFSGKSWAFVSSFWDQGGTIKGGKDYLLITILLLILPLWIYGIKKLSKTNFINILLWPVKWYYQHSLKKYSTDNQRIVLHNMGKSANVANPLEKLDENKSLNNANVEVNKIRNAVKEKINSAQH